MNMTNEQKAFCTQCGASLDPGSAFCSECGNNVAEPDHIYNSGPNQAPNSNFVYGSSDIAKTKAESRMIFIYILMVGYLFIGLLLASTGILYDQLMEIIGSDPALIDMIESSGVSYADMVLLTDAMLTFGILVAVSVALVMVSLVLSVMKTKHKIAVIFSAAGSFVLIVTYLSGISDGIFLGIIGLIVTYLLYLTKPAFID
ncbi:MAG TPA: zinc-ribbon domain-containing protein [Candidatus Methanomethylophilaceae archaeon]|nr:zinc-ribbon domain-containing protein [Candidatus Methanomethylophilaceae archaeon]